ncbi:MAG: indolepyruvate ferredoxin oxidoreductase subunit alpha [Phycisphaerae bacterium]
MAVTIDHEKCEMCGSCVDACSTDALTEVKPDDNGPKGHIDVNPDLCADCGACLSECKQGAISPAE